MQEHNSIMTIISIYDLDSSHNSFWTKRYQDLSSRTSGNVMRRIRPFQTIISEGGRRMLAKRLLGILRTWFWFFGFQGVIFGAIVGFKLQDTGF
jgi:hypothetical protein